MQKTSLSVLLVLSFLMLILTSCEKEKTFSKDFFPERAFSVHMKATKNDKLFEADIICRTYEEIEIAFTYPKELSGFNVKTTEDGYTVNVFGVPDELTKEELKDSSLLNVLVEAIRISVFTNHGMFREEEDCYKASLAVDGTPVSVTFSKDGYLRSITADSLGFSAELSQITVDKA